MSSGYPSSLPSPDEVRESQQKKLDELNKAREEKEGKVSDEVVKKEEKITSLEGMKERYNTFEINKINKEIEKLQSKKKEFFWLLKQVRQKKSLGRLGMLAERSSVSQQASLQRSHSFASLSSFSVKQSRGPRPDL